MLPLINRDNTCCFTGHRPSKLPWGYDENDARCISLKRFLFDAAESVYLSGIRHFICGMAQGCDMYFCEAVFELRREHPEITVEAAIPCENQTSGWPAEQRSRYFRLVAECDTQTVLQSEYTDGCMERRNRYMVNSSSVLIAVCDGAVGGTTQTVNMAKKNGLEIISIDPSVLK